MLLPYGEKYLVSKDGEVMNVETGCVLKKQFTGEYNTYTLFGKNVKIHSLVASLFLPKIDLPKLEIDHMNGDKFDNRASNLRWCNKSDNQRNRITSNIYETKYHTFKVKVPGFCKTVKSYDEALEFKKKYDEKHVIIRLQSPSQTTLWRMC